VSCTGLLRSTFSARCALGAPIAHNRLVILLACVAAATLGTPVLSDSFPRGVPSPTSAGWQSIAGGGDTDGELIAYELHVNLLRPGLYEITRFRTAPRVAPSASKPSPEILVWNAHPGQRKPLLCFERVSRRAWWALWLAKRWHWRPVPAGGERYRLEMYRAIQIYMLHRQSLGLPPPE
jgi:hypothetical protein